MPRPLKLAAAQMGPNHLTSTREEILDRMVALLRDAHKKGAQMVLYPETAFNVFFPRYLFTDQAELDTYFEHGDNITTNPRTAVLFQEAKKLGIDISVGYAERCADGTGYNTQVYYSASQDQIISKYRKVHLPGTFEPFANPDAVNQLEKKYFKPGNLGFPAFRAPDLVPGALKKGTPEAATTGKGDPIMGMLICNDRRWPEGWRVYGLQGVEVVMCGYNTTGWAPDLWGTARPLSPKEAYDQAVYQHVLCMKSNSYMNSCFSVSAAKAGLEDGKFDLINGSCITGPDGHVIAQAKTNGDEIVFAEVDLEDCYPGKKKTFDFVRHRRTESYGLIVEQTGVVEPELL